MKKIFTIFLVACGLSTYAQIPANDNCANAQAIIIPASGNVCITSSNALATSDLTTDACDTGTPGNEVWFTYIANGSQNTITVSPTGANPATFLVVTTTLTGCNSGTYSTCGAAATANGTASTFDGLTVGDQVWISVETNGTDGDFQLCINSVNVPPAPGQACSTATLFCDKSDFSVANMNPKDPSGFKPSCWAFGNSVKNDQWIKFTVGVTGDLEWLVNPKSADEFDYAVYDITSGCPGTQVSCNYTFSGSTGADIGMQASGNTAEIIAPITVTAGRTYAILIDNFDGTGGFDFSWTGSSATPFQMGTTALFTASPLTSCTLPLTVNLTNTSVGATSYSWNFGDGTTSTAANPGSHVYTTNGDYIISLIASGPTCTDVTSVRVNLNSGPVITIAPPSPTICQGDSVQLNATIAMGTPLTQAPAQSNNTITAIPSNNATGITTNITISGITPTTLSSTSVFSICFTIDHTKHSDMGNGDIFVTAPNGATYSYGSALPNVSGVATYCFPISVLAGMSGGNVNGIWKLTVRDTRGGGGGTGNLNGWTIIMNTTNTVQSYSWSPTTNLNPSTSLNPYAKPSSTTTYTLTATDQNGCQGSKAVTVTVKAKPTATISGSATICPSATTSVSVALVGTAPWSITYTLNGGSPTTVNNILSSPYTFTTGVAGTYAVSNVTDATGCSNTGTGSAVITVNPVIVTSAQTATCNGANTNYTVVFNISGGTPPYVVTGMTGGTVTGAGPYTFTSNTIPAGTTSYSFNVSDGIGCTPVTTVSGTKNCGCNVTGTVVPTSGGTVCTGATAPDVVFNFSGGTVSPYTLVYAINGTPQPAVIIAAGFPNSTYSITSPGAGNYTIVSIADGGCTGSGSGNATVSFMPLPTSTVSGGGTICSGTSTNVNIALTGTGPWNLTYAINGVNQPAVVGINSSPYVISASVAGNYTVTALSDVNCTGTSFVGSATVTVNPIPDVSNNPLTETICSGDNTSITLTSSVAGTTFDYTASVSSGTVTGFTATASGVTSINDVLTNSTVSSGSVTYSITPIGPAPTFCIGNDTTFVVTVNPRPVVADQTPTICSGSAFSVSPAGVPAGTTYTWSTPTISPLGAITGGTAQAGQASISETLTNTTSAPATATYTVTPTSGTCAGNTFTITVTVNPIPNVTNAVLNQSICSGDSAVAVLTADVSGTTFTWTASSVNGIVTDFMPAGSGNISDTLTNTGGAADTIKYVVTPLANGCSGTPVTFAVAVNPTPVITNTNLSKFLCSGDTVDFTPLSNIPGTTFSWTATSPGGNITGFNAAGNGPFIDTLVTTGLVLDSVKYVITPTANLCPGVPVTLTVYVNPIPKISPLSDITTCGQQAVGSVTFASVPAGASITWTNLNNTTGAAGSGTNVFPGFTSNNNFTTSDKVDSILIEADNGCISDTVMLVIIKPSPTFSVVANNPVTCGGTGSIDINSLTPSTSYNVYYTTPGPVVNGPFPLTSSAGGTINIPNLPQDSYSNITVESIPFGCKSVAPGPYVIFFNGTPPMPVVTTPVTYCQNDVATDLSGNATGTALLWYTIPVGGTGSATAPTPTTTTPGTTLYYVSQTTSGCEGPRDTIKVIVNPLPAAPAVTPVTYCQNATATDLSANATGSGLLWYAASTGGVGSATAPTPTTTTVGTTSYFVSQTTTGCEGPRAQVDVTIKALPAGPVVTTPVNYCVGDVAIPLAATGTSLTWYTVPAGGSGSGTVPTPLTTTAGPVSYYVSQTVNGCEGPRTQIDVTVFANPSAAFTATPNTGTAPLSVDFTSSNTTGMSAWTFGNGLTGMNDTTIIYPAGIYNVIHMVTENGCSSTANTTIVVNGTFSIPNVFTPNGDAKNETFLVTSDGVGSFSMEIFDRWGIKMFSSSNINEGWSGKTLKGNDAPTGTYFYIIIIKDTNGKEYPPFRGSLTLLRN